MNLKEWNNWWTWYKELPQNKEVIESKILENKDTLLSPRQDLWFRPLEEIDPSNIKVILIGNTPHNEAYASDGICFSSYYEPDEITQLLYQKIEQDLNVIYDIDDNTKDHWIEQGILPLCFNWTITCGDKHVRDNSWDVFSRELILHWIQDNQPRVFLFLEQYSHKWKKYFISGNKYHWPLIFCDLKKREVFNQNIFLYTNNFVKQKYNVDLNWK